MKGKTRKRPPVQYISDFNFDNYIPFRLVQAQLWMHRILRPESTPSVRKVAKISKVQSRVLLMVALNNAITPTQIADKIGLDPAVVTHTIATLAKKGLATTAAHFADQRSKSIHVTRLGKRLCDELVAVISEFDEYLYSLLDSSETEVFLQILDKLLVGSRRFPKSFQSRMTRSARSAPL